MRAWLTNIPAITKIRILVIGMLFGVATIITFGCITNADYQEKPRWAYYLPSGATNVVVIDHDWHYFDLDGHRYLMYIVGGNSGFALTEVFKNKCERE